MLKEREVLMVPPSRERLCEDHDVVLRRCGESMKAKVSACHPTQQQQGRPPCEGLDLAGATGEGEECVGGEDGGEREPARELDVTGVDYERPLGASSVSTTGFYAFPQNPAGVLISPSRGHSTKMDSQDFGGSRAPAVNGFSAAAPSRAPLIGEKIYAANGRQNGVVGLSEKRMRNGVALASSSAPSGVGNRSGGGEFSPMGAEEEEEDCGEEEEEPLRKRAHISADAVYDFLDNAKAWATKNGRRGPEHYFPTLKEQELELPYEANKPPSGSDSQAGLGSPPPSGSEAQAGLAPPPPSDSEAQAGFAPPPPAADTDADAEAAGGNVLVRKLSKVNNEQGEFECQFVRRDTTTTTPLKKLHEEEEEEEEEEEAKTSGDPDVKIEFVPFRTEGNGDVGVADGEAVQLSDGGMNDDGPSDGPEETIPGSGEEERLDTLQGERCYDFSTAMEVDPNPTFSADFAENPSARAAAEPVDEEMQREEEQEEQEQETVSERDDATVGAPEPPVFGPTAVGPPFGHVFDEVRRESGNSADPSGRWRSQDLNQPPLPPHAANHANHVGQKRSVEVIEFDSDDDEEPSDDDVREVKESDGSSTKDRIPVSQQRRNGYRYYTSESTPPSENAEEESDSDDCQVVGSWRPPYAQNVASLRRQQSAVAANLAGASLPRQSAAANPVVVDVVDEDEENYTTSGQSSDSSDVEEVADTQSEIRRRWEDAALRRRMGRAMQSAGSQLRGGRDGGAINLGDDCTESQGLEESVATSNYRDSPDSKDQTETSEARGGPEGGGIHRTGGAHPTVASRVSEEQRPAQWRSFMDSNGDHAVKPPEMPAAASGRPISVDINAPGGASDEEPYDTLLSKQHVRVDVPGVGRAELDKLGTPSAAAAAAQVRSASHKEEASSRSADQLQNGDVRWEDVRWEGQQQRGVAAAEGLDIEPSENGDAAVGNAEEGTEASTAGAAAALVAAAHEDDAVGNADEEASTAAAPFPAAAAPFPAAAAVASDEDLLEGKDKLKQTLHYKKTEEAEWASRQVEIERQAMEVKRLRHRKKQEAERKREMERKQKERIEELRLSQRKEERNMDLRDQLRGQVRAELERIAANCIDFATLLRQLGVPVEGGSHPSEKQVNAAYKKALFKFHPDRAVASSGGEPKYQVEAEEKFKLIQRSKDTLQPVVYNDYGISNKYSRPIF